MPPADGIVPLALAGAGGGSANRDEADDAACRKRMMGEVEIYGWLDEKGSAIAGDSEDLTEGGQGRIKRLRTGGATEPEREKVSRARARSKKVLTPASKMESVGVD